MYGDLCGIDAFSAYINANDLLNESVFRDQMNALSKVQYFSLAFELRVSKLRKSD